MKKQSGFFFLAFLFVPYQLISQDFQITPPRLEFDGNQLMISYDIINAKISDQFYIWIEIEKKNGDLIRTKAISGDVGDKINGGKNKRIKWNPEKDSVLINEEILVQVSAEKYVKSFDKGPMILRSLAFPGWGQTKISKGKPWWLIGVVSYGTLCGFFISKAGYFDTYDLYSSETDPIKRTNLYNKSQKQLNTSSALLIASEALWAGNLLWVSFTPNKYQPMQHMKVSIQPSPGPVTIIPQLALRFNF